jgi:hypothetical protein
MGRSKSAGAPAAVPEAVEAGAEADDEVPF